MVTDSLCPVCGGQITPGERQCPRCDWELESDYVLGPLTPEREAAYQEQLAWARRLWQERQQREVAQRELVAAQAELARLRQPLEAPHREPTTRPEVRTREQPPLLTLRGTFVAPDFIQQGMVRRLGRGVIHTVIPVEGTLVVVIAGGGAALFDLRSGQAIWEIDCPARCGALSPDGSVLALGTDQHVWLWNLRDGRPRCLQAALYQTS